jgi:cGMP-dependent protein kinase
LKREDGFGELALLYNSPRSSTIKAAEDSCLWVIERLKFRRAVEDIVLKNYEENRKFMEISDFYRKFPIFSLIIRPND